MGPVKSWPSRLVEAALAVLAAALMLDWAYRLLQPLVPVIVVVAGLFVLTSVGLRPLRQW